MLFISPREDLKNTLQFINDFTKSIGETRVDVDISKVHTLIKIAVQNEHYVNGDVEGASVFKKISSVVASFIANQPIESKFAEENIGKELHRINNCENIILAFEVAVYSLHNATIHRSDGKEVTLCNKIRLSTHSYIELIDALSGVTPSSGLLLVSVLLEQMAYRANPECSYPQMK